MPKDVFDAKYQYLPQSSLLSFEEITRLAHLFVASGVRKIRLTGGEPLLRKNLEVLVEQLAALRTPQGHPVDLTLTTNGALLARKAHALRNAGLQRVTVSLDSLDDAVFRRMNDVDFPVAEVLDGIAAAQDAGLGTIKVNMVVQRGVNEHQILPMARYFKGSGIALRFIEYMDVGNSNGWRMDDVLPSSDVIELLRDEFSLTALEATTSGETAQRWGYADATGAHDPSAGEIGVISSVTKAFCRDCTRARLSTEGKVYLCLFAGKGHDLRDLMRSGASDEALSGAIRRIWTGRADRYSALRGASTHPETTGPNNSVSTPPRVEMSHIGG